VLVLLLLSNGLNALLDLLFVPVLGMRVEGVAFATVLAEIVAFAIGCWLLLKREGMLPRLRCIGRLFAAGEALALFHLNRDLFLRHAGIDGLTTDAGALRDCLRAHGHGPVAGLDSDDPDPWRDLILTHVIEPRLRGRAVFVHDYPASQAALARLKPGRPAVAERFELFVDGMELANGFRELTDASEQRRRFEAELSTRLRTGLPPVPVRPPSCRSSLTLVLERCSAGAGRKSRSH
jgi:hypothetical protein